MTVCMYSIRSRLHSRYMIIYIFVTCLLFVTLADLVSKLLLSSSPFERDTRRTAVRERACVLKLRRWRMHVENGLKLGWENSKDPESSHGEDPYMVLGVTGRSLLFPENDLTAYLSGRF